MARTVKVTVELFGTARIACGRRTIEVELPAISSMVGLSAIVAEVCPELVGVALRDDLLGLMQSYTLNLNGVEFVEGCDLTLNEGDTLLLFSSQAGG